MNPQANFKKSNLLTERRMAIAALAVLAVAPVVALRAMGHRLAIMVMEQKQRRPSKCPGVSPAQRVQ